MGHFAKDCGSKKKGDFKGKHHASAAAEEEELRRRTRESSSDQERREEYYLVSTLSGSFTNSKDSWLVDSGASRHMTGYKGVLLNFKEKSYSVQVKLRNEVSYAIKGTGSISFQLECGSVLHLEEVLYLLGLKKSLIFVDILENKGYKVTLMEGKALLWSKNEDCSSTLVIGVQEGGL